MSLRARLLALLLASLLVGIGAAATGAGAARPLGERLARALNVDGVDPALTAALVVDTQTGKPIFARNAKSSLVPASTEKLPVAFAALTVLGPSHRSRTVVLGRGTQTGPRWKGHLVLKGFGDPSLHRDDLRKLARQIAERGIRRVTGLVIGDESYFDAERTAPGWRPSFYKVWSPPLSALVVDRAFFRGATVDRPATAAARAFRAELKAAGVRVKRGAKSGRVNQERAVELASVDSPSVEELVRLMNTESDNFTAEMLLKQLGAHVRGKGTTASGASVVRQTLREAGVRLDGVRIVDGSGLSSLDRLTAPLGRRSDRGGAREPGDLGRVSRLARARRRHRHPRGSNAEAARVRSGTRQDRHDQPLLGPQRHSWRPLHLLDHHERRVGAVVARATGAGQVRHDPRTGPIAA